MNQASLSKTCLQKCPKQWNPSYSAGLIVIKAKTWLKILISRAYPLLQSFIHTSSSLKYFKVSLQNSFPQKFRNSTISLKTCLSKRSNKLSERSKDISRTTHAWCSSKAHSTRQNASLLASWSIALLPILIATSKHSAYWMMKGFASGWNFILIGPLSLRYLSTAHL